MMASNLPPGCNSADGGINHAQDSAEEKALELWAKEGLGPEEVIMAAEIGLAHVKAIKTAFQAEQKQRQMEGDPVERAINEHVIDHHEDPSGFVASLHRERFHNEG